MLYYLAAMNAICIQMYPVMCIHVYAIHGCYVFQTDIIDRQIDRPKEKGRYGWGVWWFEGITEISFMSFNIPFHAIYVSHVIGCLP